MLSAKRIIGTRIVILTTIFDISSTPFPGAFLWIQTAFCREASSTLIINHKSSNCKATSFFLQPRKNFFCLSVRENML